MIDDRVHDIFHKPKICHLSLFTCSTDPTGFRKFINDKVAISFTFLLVLECILYLTFTIEQYLHYLLNYLFLHSDALKTTKMHVSYVVHYPLSNKLDEVCDYNDE